MRRAGRVTGYALRLDLGFGMDTVLELYDQDGATLLMGDDDGGLGYASLLRWQPAAAGTYHVLVRPYSDAHDVGYCDAVYTLQVRCYRVWMPLVLRQ